MPTSNRSSALLADRIGCKFSGLIANLGYGQASRWQLARFSRMTQAAFITGALAFVIGVLVVAFALAAAARTAYRFLRRYLRRSD